MNKEDLHATILVNQKLNHHESQTVKNNGQFLLDDHSFIGYRIY